MDLLHRIDPVSGIYLNSSYQVGSPYIQSNWTLIEKELPNPNIFNVTNGILSHLMARRIDAGRVRPNCSFTST
jgi:hypothetical protein